MALRPIFIFLKATRGDYKETNSSTDVVHVRPAVSKSKVIGRRGELLILLGGRSSPSWLLLVFVVIVVFVAEHCTG